MAALAGRIRAAAVPVDEAKIAEEVRAYLDAAYPDLASLAGPSRKTRRTLQADIEYWDARAAEAKEQLDNIEAVLPGAIEEARQALGSILERAQALRLERYKLSDDIAALLAEIDSSAPLPDADVLDGEGLNGVQKRAETLLERVEASHAAIQQAEAALAWSSVLERTLKLSAATLDPAGHVPSALASLPHFRQLAASVAEMERTLPPGMALLGSLRTIRDDTWSKLRDTMNQTLVKATEPLKWPMRVDYPSVPAPQRRAFERAYVELLFLQTEGEKLGVPNPPAAENTPAWAAGIGLYPVVAMCGPISLRFKYHFQGSRNTNRVDKPEWAFANIRDAVFEHAAFIADYLQPLTARGGYGNVDVKSEFTMLLMPTLLSLLRTRIPHILSHPALLAHTVYQTILYDDATRENGFDLARTSLYRGEEVEWEGLAGVILREQDWFEQWLAGEKKFAENSLNDIITSPTAWNITDTRDDDDEDDTGMPATQSARQVRSLIEQITDRYAPLPAYEYRAAFLLGVQLPLLAAYLQRVTGSLDAFESLSTAFVRVVPGALTNRAPDARITGTAGLDRLIKAHVSADYILAGLRTWSDDMLFAEMSADMAAREPVAPGAVPSVWDPTSERYASLMSRAEDMLVRQTTSEVESDLKLHLQRRWDLGLTDADETNDSSLVTGLTSFTTFISHISRSLPRPAVARIYRRVVLHLANHIAQRGVYAGWSKFTAAGGRALAQEVEDWRAAAQRALRATPGINTDAPWARLDAMATVLRLPSEAEVGVNGKTGDSPTFAQAMAAAWGSEAALQSLFERIGVTELDGEDLQMVLRRRIECWR